MKMPRISMLAHVHKSSIINLIFILLLGLLPLTWFKGDFIITGGDMNFPLRPKDNLYFSFYVWQDKISTGEISPRYVTWLPLMLFLTFSEIIGLSLVTTEKILFCFLFTSSGLSMYYLTSTVVSKEKKRATSLIAALFYMFNPYAMVVIWGTHLLPLISLYAFLPFILAFYIRGLNGKGILLYSLLICGFSMLMCHSNANPVFTFILFFVLFSYLVCYILKHLRNRKKVIHAFLFTGFLVIVWIGLNAWWIIPRFFCISEEFEYATELMGGSNIEILKFTSVRASLFNILRLQGYWAFYANHDTLYPYASIYSTGIFILISLLIPLSVFSSLLFKSRNKSSLTYFACLSLISIFIAQGSYPPLGEIFIWAMSNFPVLGIFRMPFHKFMTITTLCYAVLFGNGLVKLYYYIKGQGNISTKINVRWKLINRYLHSVCARRVTAVSTLLILVSSICVIYTWPMWTGDVIYQGSEIRPSHLVKVPTYYTYANDWLSEQNDDFRVFIIPLGADAFNWNHGYVGAYLGLWLFSKPTAHWPKTNDVVDYVFNLIEQNQTQCIGKTLTLLNMKYIMVHNDIDQKYHEWVNSPEYYRSVLNSQKGFQLKKSFGELDFYENDYWKSMHIYAASNATLVSDGLGGMMKIIENDDFTLGEHVLFLSNQLDSKQLSFILETGKDNHTITPEITYEKINPTKYVVQVNASNPFFLVFSESYHKYWVCHVDGKDVKEHFMANGYANAWYINKTGSYDIVLEFWPQSSLYAGAITSLTTFVLCILYLGKDCVKTFYKQHIKRRNNLLLIRQ